MPASACFKYIETFYNPSAFTKHSTTCHPPNTKPFQPRPKRRKTISRGVHQSWAFAVQAGRYTGERLRLSPDRIGKKLAGNLLTQSIRVPTDEDLLFFGCGLSARRHRSLGSAWMTGLQLLDFFEEGSSCMSAVVLIAAPHQLGRQVTGAVLAV